MLSALFELFPAVTFALVVDLSLGVAFTSAIVCVLSFALPFWLDTLVLSIEEISGAFLSGSGAKDTERGNDDVSVLLESRRPFDFIVLGGDLPVKEGVG